MKIIKGLPRPAEKDELVALDVEIFRQEEPLHIPTGDFACLSIAFPKRGEQYMITDHHDVKETLERVDKGVWVMHNALYDISQLRRWATIKDRKIWDTMLMEHALFGGYFETFSLDALALRYLGVAMDKDIRMSFKDSTKMNGPLEQYAIRDARYTVEIAKLQDQYLIDNDINPKWYWDIDMPMIFAVLDFVPVKVDVDGWRDLAISFGELAEAIRDEAGFNPGSPQQAKEAINNYCDIKVSNTNAMLTLEPLVETLKDQGKDKEASFIDMILRYRMYKRASSAYGLNWIEKHIHEGNLVYPGWLITGTETGRMACREPNLQNIPARKLPEYRYLFISQHKRGRIMVSDVSQQEPRITAHFSKDSSLMEAFEKDEDIHQWVADIISENRDRGKALNLGMTYGLTKYGLAKRLGITEKQAEQIIRKYFTRFRGVKRYVTSKRKRGLREGKVYSAYGRPIWLNPYQRQWENNAVNAPIQGSAADHTKLAVIYNRQMCKDKGERFCVNMVIHDEKVNDLMPGETPAQRKIAEEAWIEAGKVIVDTPMKVDIVTGTSWGVKQDDD
jgi:DNA polymerase-1